MESCNAYHRALSTDIPLIHYEKHKQSTTSGHVAKYVGTYACNLECRPRYWRSSEQVKYQLICTSTP